MMRKTVNKVKPLAVLIVIVTSIFYTLHFRTKAVTDQSNEVWLSKRLKQFESWTREDGYFPIDGQNVCPYMGIRKIPFRLKKLQSGQVCKARVPSVQECRLANTIYDIGKEPLTCKVDNDITLCTINTLNSPDSIVAKCNVTPCDGNPVFIASIDPRIGELQDKNDWKMFHRIEDLERALPEIVQENTKNGFHFCFLECRSRSKDIKTIMNFHPKWKISSNSESTQFNINVLVLDSVSRAHFYRSLPKTVSALRQIEYNSSLQMKVFDYSLLQSLSPFTYLNIKAFFTGNSFYHAEDAKTYKASQNQYYYGYDHLYDILKKKGFYTIFQEDLCWYDVWGTMLANTKKSMEMLNNPEKKKARWQEFYEELRGSKIDDTGLTLATCPIFKHLNITNQFNKPEKICYGSKPISKYYLDYLEKMFSSSSESAGPLFAYTHLNVAHETTGVRIQQIDEELANYLTAMAHDQNTLTILFSDHGPKTTPYSTMSMEGMYEVYSPFLFILLPNTIANILGEKRVENLENNQNRFITPKDLHFTLSYILDRENKDLQFTAAPRNEGLFGEISVHRYCSLNKESLCICSGFETWFPDNHHNFTWIAEFLLGEINNEIQRQYTRNMRFGLGKCQKLIGAEFTDIYRKEDKKNYFVTMHLVTNPLKEKFQVTAKFPKTPPSIRRKFKQKRQFIRLISNRRATTYQAFFECKDSNVDLQLCVCKRKSYNVDKKWHSWISLNSSNAAQEIIRRHSNFGANQTIKSLDAKCLYLVTRSHNNRQSLAYDIANVCEDSQYVVTIYGPHSLSSRLFTSSSLPFVMKVKPLTIKFALAVYHFRKPLDFKPLISFKSQ